MFESDLKAKFKAIFGVKKVTFDQPSDSREQECIFIEVETPRITIKDDRQIARVTGTATMFGNNEKLPFGFFAKRIKQAPPALTAKFFFYDIEANTKQYLNLVSRAFSFTYLFDSQYDPENGSITSVEISEGDS